MNKDYFDEFVPRGKQMTRRKYSGQSYSTADSYYRSYSDLSNKYDMGRFRTTEARHSADLGSDLSCNIF